MHRTIAELIGDRFGNYAKYIIQDRALPDVRDGLKPVQRRILYAMWKLNLTPDGNFRKAARIVGEVIGKYHPHGDNSVYDALIRLSQSWRRRYPLILIQGNNGSIDGDPAAAMRYTESKLALIAYNWLLTYLHPPAVQFRPNFDESDHEPVVLAAQLPFALLNGSSGIAAGYATNIPPHNLTELVKALMLLVRNPAVTLDTILTVIQGPDFPTGGIIDRTNLKLLYQTGRGRINIRAKIKIIDRDLLIYEIPFEQTKSHVYAKLQQILLLHPNLNVERVVDESDRSGLKIRLYLKKMADPEIIMNFLFRHTPLAISYHANMVMIVRGRPQRLNLLSYLREFIRFHTTVLTTHYEHQLQLITKRLHLLDGIIRAMTHLDIAIKIIRQARNRSAAEVTLSQQLDLSPEQAQAVAQLRLYQLTSTDLATIKQKNNQLLAQQQKINHLLTNQTKFKQHQIQLWKSTIKQLNDQRRTEIVEQFNTTSTLPLPVAGNSNNAQPIEITITRDGYIIGCLKVSSKKKDYYVKDHDEIILQQTKLYGGFFYIVTNYGQAFRWPLSKLKFNQRSEFCQHVSQIIRMAHNSKIIQAVWVNNDEATQRPLTNIHQWIVGLSSGRAKLILNQDLKWTERVKKIIKIADNHEVIYCQPLKKTSNSILIGTQQNRWLKIRSHQIPYQKLTGGGAQLIKLDAGDRVKCLMALSNEVTKLVMVANDYMIKTIDLKHIKTANRGTKGRIFYFGRQRKSQLKVGFIANNSFLELSFCQKNKIHQIKLNLNLTSSRQLIKHLMPFGSPSTVRLFLSCGGASQSQKLKFLS